MTEAAFIARAAIKLSQESLGISIRELKVSNKNHIHGLIRDRYDKFDPEIHALGSWDCDRSPFGLCMYNNEYDPEKDDCIFCHKPDERK